MDPHVIATAAKVGNVIESLLAALRPGRHGPTAKALRIVPHRSVGDAERLTVRGRVVWQAPTNRRPLGRTGAITTREHLAALYRAFDAVELPFAVVEAELDGVRARATCDVGGFFAVDLAAGHAHWSPGRHLPSVRLVELGPTATSTAHLGQTGPASIPVEVYVAGANATLAVVSDLDDTAMDTNTLHTWAAIRTVMFRSARRRSAVPGVAELYAALCAGPDGMAQNPICYISSGAWNLYDIVLDYLETHGLPDGAIFLNDWGSRTRSFHPVGHAHKAAHVTALLTRLPNVPFLLVGDDVQEDPELYAQVALQHPGRVPAIWIRAVRNSDDSRARIAALQPALANSGTGIILAPDTTAFTADAANRGWLPKHMPPLVAR